MLPPCMDSDDVLVVAAIACPTHKMLPPLWVNFPFNTVVCLLFCLVQDIGLFSGHVSLGTLFNIRESLLDLVVSM